MKIHRVLEEACTEALYAIFKLDWLPDRAVDKALKSNVKFGARDRKFIASTIYGCVRNYRLYQACISNEIKEKARYAEMIRVYLVHQGSIDFGLVNAPDQDAIALQLKKLQTQRVFRESISDWLDDFGTQQLGEQIWERELRAMNHEADVFLRANTLKISSDELQSVLLAQQIETILPEVQEQISGWAPMKLVKRQSLAQLEAYKKGMFEIQDAASQLVAPMLQPASGMTVVDACAGAGGKTLHIASLMRGIGKIIAMDTDASKLEELNRRANKAGASCITTHQINEGLIKQYHAKADRLLLDVPCSGSGVIRRNPATKFRLTSNFMHAIVQTQQLILANYTKMLKAGGKMVYATCSIFPCENEEQVYLFMKNNAGNFKLIDEKRILPSSGFDGFYMALIEKIKD